MADTVLEQCKWLQQPDGSRLAWCGAAKPDGVTIVFLAGHGSDMAGTKALATAEWAAAQGHGMIRFDYFGHGISDGNLLDGTISRWKQDCLAIIDQIAEGRLVLVGSSLGGWLMILAALARPERVAALVGIAAAPDFTEDLIWDELDEPRRRQALAEGRITEPNPYDPEGEVVYPMTLIEDGRKNLVLRSALPLHCPVRLLHGMEDAEVPWQTAEKLASVIRGCDTEVILAEGAGHRFSEPDQLDLLISTLAEVTRRIH